MLTPEEGRHVTVCFDAMAALLCWNDGQRTLVGTDGFAVPRTRVSGRTATPWSARSRPLSRPAWW